MLPFENAYSNASHYTYTHSSKVSLARKHLDYIAKYIYSCHLSDPEKSLGDLINDVFSDYYTSSKVPFINPLIHYDSIRYEASRYLLTHPQKIDELLKEIEEKGLKDTRPEKVSLLGKSLPKGFSGDFEESLLYFVLYEKSDFDKYLDKYTNEDIEFIREHYDFIKKHLGSQPYMIRKLAEESLPLVIGTYSQRLKAYIFQHQSIYEKELRDSLADSISRLAQTLDKYGFLSNYANLYNVQMQELGLPELGIPEKSSKDNPNLKSIFSINFLHTLSLEQLLLLNHFYINRMTKEFENMKEGFFLVDDLDLYEDIIEKQGKVAFSVSDNTLYDELIKMNMLQQATNDCFAKLPGELSEYNDKDIRDSKAYIQTAMCARKQWNKKYAQKFYPYFSEEESKNYLSFDLSFYTSLYTPVHFSYAYKDNSSTAILAHLLHSKGFSNWGYISEENSEGKNTIEAKNKFLLIGIDCEGLNRPIFTHEISSKIANFFRTYSDSTIIPVYNGIDDFIAPESLEANHPYIYAHSNILKNNITVPLSTKHKKIIKSIRKSNDKLTPDNIKFFRHLDSLRNSRSTTYDPLREKQIEGFDHTSVSIPPIPRFVDLATGKYYSKLNDAFVELKNSNCSNDLDFDDDDAR